MHIKPSSRILLNAPVYHHFWFHHIIQSQLHIALLEVSSYPPTSNSMVLKNTPYLPPPASSVNPTFLRYSTITNSSERDAISHTDRFERLRESRNNLESAEGGFEGPMDGSSTSLSGSTR
ncbi:hypothetical protein AOQ84DRAFT_374417 [Glonium stellatum]|uniref:Uncharacterized protein n=1 Tax=Glonium stellatum TaxID=574774 RepID=A0A8E2F5U8_9PEZI|nr:hypothetical protein AOQ84DRAFT_374417 [Glonium stellatum]